MSIAQSTAIRGAVAQAFMDLGMTLDQQVLHLHAQEIKRSL